MDRILRKKDKEQKKKKQKQKTKMRDECHNFNGLFIRKHKRTHCK